MGMVPTQSVGRVLVSAAERGFILGGEQMKRKCQVCGQENGSCNRYYFNPAEIITICPACLAFSSDDKAKIARRAHKDGKLVKEEGAKKRWQANHPAEDAK